jgi:hypothetical protein
MAERGVHEVGEEEEVHEDALLAKVSMGSASGKWVRMRPHLRGDDGEAKDEAGLSQLEEGEEVHPLVLGFLEERVDPAVVAVHVPERS